VSLLISNSNGYNPISILLAGFSDIWIHQRKYRPLLWDSNVKVVGRLTRLWESKNMRSRTSDSLISIDGVIVDEDVSNLFPASW
jgi:hypothetical protein